MKRIISLVTVVIIMVNLCTTTLISASSYSKTTSIVLRNIPGTPGNITNPSIKLQCHECDLRIENMVNCYVIVNAPTSNYGSITVYSPGTYHLIFFMSNNTYNTISFDLIPINPNAPSYCYVSIAV